MGILLRTLVLALGVIPTLVGQDRWRLEGPGIAWEVAKDPRLPHTDRIEVAGRRVAAWIRYGADREGNLVLDRLCVWPTLRVAPNDTRSSLMVRFGQDRGPTWVHGRREDPLGSTPFEPVVRVEGREVPRARLERVVHAEGLLRLETGLGPDLALVREICPSAEGNALLERWVLTNRGTQTLQVEVPPRHDAAVLPYDYQEKGLVRPGRPTPPTRRRTGAYHLALDCEGCPSQSLVPGGSLALHLVFSACRQGVEVPTEPYEAARQARRDLSGQLRGALCLECPDPVVATLFDFAKLRACDSVVATKNGPMHAPGGASYYAAIWANDTVEYVAPFYPFLGYAYGNEASLNALEHFARFLNPDFRPLPSSIIAEGTDTWAGAGDRGDQAMLAYGASRFLLALGDPAAARRHWPLVTWCLEYLARKTNAQGLIPSDTDELEGRFSAGKVNLNTNMLAYGALLAAADLATELGEPALARTYRDRAKALGGAMEAFFGAEVRGFPTYRYHDGLEELRAWICIPLTMGILDRRTGTLAALFSPRLWTAEGLLTAEGSTTFWDRSTLYALRGVFQAGAPDLALKHLQAYARRRLLGDHVPYPVEAFPEGNGRHLSAESALYGRIVTEGLFGLRPTGFRRVVLRPSLPGSWDHMALRGIRAFGSRFDVEVRRQKSGRLQVKVRQGGKVLVAKVWPEGGGEVEVRLSTRQVSVVLK